MKKPPPDLTGILREVFKQSGVQVRGEIKITCWRIEPNLEKSYVIKSIQEFVRSFGEGYYQIEAQDAIVTSADTKQFHVNYITIGCLFSHGQWQKEKVHTEIEEATPEECKDFQLVEKRMSQLASQTKGVLNILYLTWSAAEEMRRVVWDNIAAFARPPELRADHEGKNKSDAGDDKATSSGL
jgi:hypothetical protein